MSNEGFDQFMRESHVVKNHHKIILRGSQQVRTENDGQGFRCHVIMLFVVGDSSKRERKKDQSDSNLNSTTTNVLVKMF